MHFICVFTVFFLQEYSQNLILPTKPSTEVTNCAPASPNPPVSKRTEPTHCRQPKDLSMEELTFTDEFFCTPDDLYKVLTTKEVCCCAYVFVFLNVLITLLPVIKLHPLHTFTGLCYNQGVRVYYYHPCVSIEKVAHNCVKRLHSNLLHHTPTNAP